MFVLDWFALIFGFVLGCLISLFLPYKLCGSSSVKQALADRACELEEKTLTVMARLIVGLLSNESVSDTVSELIAKGINTWLVDKKSQDNIRLLFHSNDKVAMKELGRKLPGMMSSFSSGVVSSVLKYPKESKLKEECEVAKE